MNPMTTVEKLMAHGLEMELKAVDFLDADGNKPKSYRKVKRIRYTFHDGEVFEITKAESAKLDHYQFKLRPARDDG